jgi:hypothetical protein
MSTFSFTDITLEAYKRAYRGAVVDNIEYQVSIARVRVAQYLLEAYAKTSIDRATAQRVDIRCNLLEELQSMADYFEYYEDRNDDFSRLSASILEQNEDLRTRLFEHIYAYDRQGALQLAEDDFESGYDLEAYDSEYDYITSNISSKSVANFDFPENVWISIAERDNLWEALGTLDEDAFEHALDYDRPQFRTEVESFLNKELDLNSGQDLLDDEDSLGDIAIEALKEGQLTGVAIQDIDLKYLYIDDAALDSTLQEIQMLQDFARSENYPVDDAEIVIPFEHFSTDLRDVIFTKAKVKVSILVHTDVSSIRLEMDSRKLENISNIYLLTSAKDHEFQLQASLPTFGGGIVCMRHYSIYRNMLSARSPLRHMLYSPKYPSKQSLALEGLSPSSRIIIDVPERVTTEVHVDSNTPTTVYFRHDPSITEHEISQLLFVSNIIFYFSPNIKSERHHGPQKYHPPLRFFRAVEFDSFIDAFENDRSLGSFDPGIEIPDTAIFLSEKNLPTRTQAAFIAPSYDNVYINTRIPITQAVFGRGSGLREMQQIEHLTNTPHINSQSTPRGAGQDHRAGFFASSYITAQFAQSNDLEGAIFYRCIFEDAGFLPESSVKVDCVGTDPSRTYKR